mgnify:CR=1 FL=1
MHKDEALAGMPAPETPAHTRGFAGGGGLAITARNRLGFPI